MQIMLFWKAVYICLNEECDFDQTFSSKEVLCMFVMSTKWCTFIANVFQLGNSNQCKWTGKLQRIFHENKENEIKIKFCLDFLFGGLLQIAQK